MSKPKRKGKRVITTTLKEDLYQIAKKKKIPWNEALELGIRRKAGFRGEKELIDKEIESLNQQLNRLMERREAISQMEAEMDVMSLEKVFEVAKKVVEVNGCINYDNVEYWSSQLIMPVEELEGLLNQEFGHTVVMNQKSEKGSAMSEIGGR